MGSHAKPRTTGRRTALGALAVGATLTGVGLTAAALDPATAVLTASGTGFDGGTEPSGLSTPVQLAPMADGITDLSAAPLQSVSSLTAPANGGVTNVLNTAGGAARKATSGTLAVSSHGPAPQQASGAQTAIKPIEAVSPAASATQTGSSSTGTSSTPATSYTGKHKQTRSAAPPSDVTPLTDAAGGAASSMLPQATSLVSNVPVVGDLVRGSGVGDTTSGALGTATGTVDGTAGDDLTGVAGSLPLAGPLVGGSGDGTSALTVPGLSTLTPLGSVLPALPALPAGL